LVPEDHVLRDIDKPISFDFIYDEVKELYCEDNGRPSVDPVVLIKIILIKFLFGVRSVRQTKAIYSMRRQTIERVFADAKEKHFMRYTHYRGFAKLKTQALLTFAAMNLKKLVKWKRLNGLLPDLLLLFCVLWRFLPQKNCWA